MIVFAWRFLYGRRGRRGLNSVVLGFLGLKSGAVAERWELCWCGSGISTVGTGVFVFSTSKFGGNGGGIGDCGSTVRTGGGVLIAILILDGVSRYWGSTWG